MPDNDDPLWPNGGKPLLLRMSKIDREMLDEICARTGLNPSDALRAAIRFVHGGLFEALKPNETKFQMFKWEAYQQFVTDIQRRLSVGGDIPVAGYWLAIRVIHTTSK